MTRTPSARPFVFDPALDLEIERVVPVSASHLWRGWTDPETLKQWFCPRPWRVTHSEIDLRPGGRFFNVMEGPAGERHERHELLGSFLEIVPERRLVFTGLLGPDFRPLPAPPGVPLFTGLVLLEPLPDDQTRYIARAMHADTAARDAHAAMGFHQGWNAALDQLVELATASRR
ncbi:activator of HSP90 ATPase [Luteitalea sp. TBR-22]|uniref:SRPBCC family protein n=1 Tax=Luteitalea sp. TBR-22 TaxID=2802971 RepID=UPI001AF87CDF|nr:SRPBCC family protein [Luteitalea sp. TBR-22]BCS32262.1 activator of HSP90 ATPase [Luteitalea sp. TBR-22]